jgi:hypothetical protein
MSVGVDPVLLSIRSGVPFASVLRFASQAVVRIHFDDRAAKLVPIALGNAYLVADFVDRLDAERANPNINPKPTEQQLLDAVAKLRQDPNATVPSKETVEAGFRAIASHGYAKFLKSVANA